MDEFFLFFFGVGFLIGFFVLISLSKENGEKEFKHLIESSCERHDWSYDHLGNLSCTRCSKIARIDSENGEE